MDHCDASSASVADLRRAHATWLPGLRLIIPDQPDHPASVVKEKTKRSLSSKRGASSSLLGSGQIGNVRLSPEAETYFAKKNCKVLLQPTPKAIHVFHRSTAKTIHKQFVFVHRAHSSPSYAESLI